jgi:L-alanine-DL-glutamate epimerase-like enolase superfamily enzyme
MAQQMIDWGGLGYIQIDAGRIGGISVAKQVADYARSKGVTYVNHTFTSHLALSASLQPFAGLADDRICEYPVEPQALAVELTREHLVPDENGEIRLPDRPGLGISPDPIAVRKYLVETEIRVGGKVLYQTPSIDD